MSCALGVHTNLAPAVGPPSEKLLEVDLVDGEDDPALVGPRGRLAREMDLGVRGLASNKVRVENEQRPGRDL